MIIELTGLPGSGKTSLAKLVSKTENLEIIKVRGRVRILYYNLLFLLSRPIIFFRLLSWVIRYRGNVKLLYLKFMNCFLVANAIYQKVTMKGGGVLDQGYFQGIISLFEDKIDRNLIIKYMEILPKPDLLIILDASGDSREKRIMKRGYFSRKSMGKEYHERWREVIEDNFNKFLDSLSSIGVNHQIIDANQNPRAIFDEIKLSYATKIIYIANVRLPTEKAHGLQIMKSCEALADLGISVELVIPSRQNNFKENPFDYYQVKNNFKIKKIFGTRYLAEFFWVGRFIFYLQSIFFSLLAIYQVVKERDRSAILYSRDLITLFFLCLFRFKTVSEIHDYRLSKPSRLMRFALNKSYRIIVNSPGTLNKLKGHYQLNDSKVLIMPNGVDLNTFEINKSREQTRDVLGIPTKETIIAYIGRIETAGVDKGVGLLIEAFTLLEDQIDNISLYVIGGPDNLIRKEPSRVKFTGHVPYKRIPLYLRAVDIVVVPLPKSRHAETTSPIKLFEFMAAGKVVIVPDLPVFKEYIDDSMAFFFKSGDARDLASVIKSAIENPKQMSLKAEKIKLLSQKFTWHDRAKKIINFMNL